MAELVLVALLGANFRLSTHSTVSCGVLFRHYGTSEGPNYLQEGSTFSSVVAFDILAPFQERCHSGAEAKSSLVSHVSAPEPSLLQLNPCRERQHLISQSNLLDFVSFSGVKSRVIFN
jgi:hypothetical protein